MDTQTYQAERNKALAQFIRSMRKKCGWTQQQVADLLGISRPTAARLDSGEIPLEVTQLEMLCQAFGFDLTDYYQSHIARGGRIPEHTLEASFQNVSLTQALGQLVCLPVPANYSIHIVENRENLLVFSPNGAYLAAAYQREKGGETVERGVLIWDVKTRGLQHILVSNGEPLALAFSNRDLLAVVLKEGQVEVWDLSNEQLEAQLAGWSINNEEFIEESFQIPHAIARFSHNDNYLVVTYSQRGTHLLRIISQIQNTGFHDIQFIKTKGQITGLAFSPHDDVIFTVLTGMRAVFGYTLPDGKYWSDTHIPEGFSAASGSMDHMAILSGQNKTEFLIFCGGNGEALDAWLVDLTLSSRLKLPYHLLTWPRRSDAHICQIIPITPEYVFTIISEEVKGGFNSLSPTRNIFKLKNIITGLTVTLLDSTHHSLDNNKNMSGSEWAVMSPDGAYVAVYDKEEVRLHQLDVKPFGLPLNVDTPLPFPEVDDPLFPTLLLSNLLVSMMSGLNPPAFTPPLEQAVHLEQFFRNGARQQLFVLVAPRNDHDLVAKIEQIAHWYARDTQRILVAAPPSSNRSDKSCLLAETLYTVIAQVFGKDDSWFQGGSTAREKIPLKLKLPFDPIIIIDKAEQLDNETLNHLIQGSYIDPIPHCCFLIGRSEKLLTTLKADLSLAIRTTLVPYESFLKYFATEDLFHRELRRAIHPS